MTGWFFLLYLLVIAGLVGVAIYERQTASSLFLPVSPVLTILTILLPIISLFNTIYYHQSNSPPSHSQPHLSLPPPPSSPPGVKLNSPKSQRITLPSTLQLLQALLTVYLLSATLSPSSSGPPNLTDCLLSSQWKSLWTSHNGDAIRQIQDTLSCCGFRTVKDMAWPFPTGTPDDGAKHVDCVARYGRHTPCLGAWEAELKSAAGGEVAVLALTGLAQFVGWYFAGRGMFNSGGNGNSMGILAMLGEIWRRLVGGSPSREVEEEEEEEEEEWNNRTGRRVPGNTGNGTGRARNGRGSGGGHRGSRLLVGGGEVERLVDEVDDDNDDEEAETGERDLGRDLERGSNYGATGGNVWRSG